MPVSVLSPPKLPRTPRQCDRVACILKTARQAFAENAFHEVLMDDVAKKAGVGKGTIYRYFPDKESLYFAVIFNDVSDLKQQIQFTLPSQGLPRGTPSGKVPACSRLKTIITRKRRMKTTWRAPSTN